VFNWKLFLESLFAAMDVHRSGVITKFAERADIGALRSCLVQRNHASVYRGGSLMQLGWVWLLCSALLLPLAQGIGAWHSYSHPEHSVANAAKEADRQLPPSHLCALCLLAADLSSGALPSTPPCVLTLMVPRGLLLSLASRVWLAVLVPAYRSRAPPLIPPNFNV
jgi:hypothetical protein